MRNIYCRNYHNYFFNDRRKTISSKNKLPKKISLEEARSLLLDYAGLCRECRVPLLKSGGRVLSRNIPAPINLPSIKKSAVDGYALKAWDISKASRSNPVVLKVIGRSGTGYHTQSIIKRKFAVKVTAGVVIPEWADVVVKYEDAEKIGGCVNIFHPLPAGSNIIKSREAFAKGEIVAVKGSIIDPALVGIFSNLGIAEIPVYKKARVGLLSTGREISDPSGEFRSCRSNLHHHAAACLGLGAQPVILGNVPDKKGAIAEIIIGGLKTSDIIIITGALSTEENDALFEALKLVGGEIIFKGVGLEPGSSVSAARKNKLIICLSGDPAAALILFEMTAVPVIKKMMGFKKHISLAPVGKLQQDC